MILQYKINEEQTESIISKKYDKDNFFLIIENNDNLKDIHWTKKNKELTYKNQLFDVVKIENKNNRRYIYCVNDKKENRLVSSFNAINNNKNTSKKILNIATYVFIVEKFQISTFKNSSNFEIVQNYSTSYISKSLKIPSPPPKISA